MDSYGTGFERTLRKGRSDIAEATQDSARIKLNSMGQMGALPLALNAGALYIRRAFKNMLRLRGF